MESEDDSVVPEEELDIVLEEELDPDYEPTENDILEYALWLGMDLETEQDLFWIVREGLKAPLPADWKPCQAAGTDVIYYFNFATGQSTYNHPCDEYYRKVYEDHKKKRLAGAHAGEGEEGKLSKQSGQDEEETTSKETAERLPMPVHHGQSGEKTEASEFDVSEMETLTGLPSVSEEHLETVCAGKCVIM